MAEKKYPSRVQHKSGTSEEWGLATNFKPLEGELLVYTDAGGTDKDGKSIPQLKIGDGSTLVANLPFVGSKETEHAESAESAKEAEHATSADTATNANHAVSADTASVATTADKVKNSLTFKRDSTTIHSYNGSAAKTITFKAGSNVTLSSTTSGTLTINATDTTYSAATSSNLGLVKSGGDVTVNSDGTMSVSDDSHNHVISNVDGLQTALDGKADAEHTHSSYVNQNAFSNFTVGSTTIAADTTTDTLTFVAGSNITLTPDATNDKITIAATDTIYNHPTHNPADIGLYKVQVDDEGHVISTTAVAKSDITALGIPSTNTTYKAATSSKLGLVKSGGDVTVGTDGTMTVTDDSHAHIISNIDGLQSALDAKSATTHNHTGVYDPINSASGALADAKEYTDDKIAELVGTAPDTLNTLQELAAAIEADQTAIDVLNTTAANKADKDHTHTITANATDGIFNLTGTSGTNAVTYAVAPYTSAAAGKFDTSTTAPSGTSRLNWGGYLYATKLYSGGKEVSVSGHGHAISDVTSLQSTLDGKAESSHTHNYAGSSSAGGAATSAEKADKLSSSRTISLVGDVTGSGSFDGSSNLSITATVADDSHNHIISNVDGLQSALDGKADASHTHSSYVNQNAFSNVKVGSVTVAADNTTDTLTLVAGSNVTLTPDATNDKITIAATDTVYTHPTHDAHDLALYKVAVDDEGHVIDVATVEKSDITALGIPAQDTTYSAAGTSLGLVKSGGDVTISSGVITVNDDSHNHVIDNIDGLQTTLDGKSDTTHTHTNASMGQGYATCPTAATSTAKVATLSGYTLVTGGIVSIRFTYAVPANSSLNITGTGAKAIYSNGSPILAGDISGGTLATFIYDGTRYHLIATDYSSRAGTLAYKEVSTLSTNLSNNYYNKTTIDSMLTSIVIDDGSID